MANDEIDYELVEEFILESVEMLDDVEPLVIASKVIDQGLANSLFRPVHNIKGTAGCFNFNNISKVAHAAENLLSLIRTNEHSSRHIDVDILIKFFDYLRKTLSAVMEHHSDGGFETEAASFIRELEALIHGLSAPDVVLSPEIKRDPIATSEPETSTKAENIGGIINDAALESLKELVAEKGLDKNVLDSLASTSKAKNVEAPTSKMDDESIKIFQTEVKELLEDIENNLMSFVSNIKNIDLLRDIYRSVHTLKGNFGLFNFSLLEIFSHKIETLIDELINNTIPITKNAVEDLITIVDILQEGFELSNKNDLDRWNNKSGLRMIERYLNHSSVADFAAKASELKIEDINLSFSDKNTSTGDGSNNPSSEAGMAKKDIRIDTVKLDYLNDIVGELLIAKTMIHKDIDFNTKNGENLKKSFHFFTKVLAELQDTSMAMRMIPVSSMFKKMVRIVHDISKKTNKKVKIEFFGESTEVDKSLIDVINNPLLHMLRNSVDHGIESEEVRVGLGKPKFGTIKVGAIHESGEVWIIVSDDGRGLDRVKIAAKAHEMGLINHDGSSMTDQEVYRLIFAPGFSTAEKVSDISGRGVGMDVVMQNIQKMKGRVTIDTKVGVGTTFTIKIPLTLAIIDGMLVNCGGIKYTIPIDSITETIKAKNLEIDQIVQGQELIKVRKRMIPIVRLHNVHKITHATEKIEEGVLMVLESRGSTIALLVDQLLGQHQTIIKSLPSYFEKVNLNYIKGISGCSIQGDGEVGLILDVASLMEKIQEQEQSLATR
ncbi:MAG: hypothetical protein A2504_11620 [Bdellovibrionales bacterium RIFOXYD12_FULL_39_22]|nr:MAG: hypothetical protein A2385_16135 [Bdellovibrionales bacterium RIFOXYB1_FULL_39_21]OFZ44513.1 MAG: hypothetical protein A2485_06760 [Bdellovibrionales bacterium RIFOXYC12_FULL_39_17]OFZ49845.1 MAG: hypothetical protein A2404_00705 [Bdellovibrionales bacterium RIFOXYC1_FULL_39_130]OFZ73011.1 MAG: hypothetical protein A2451_15980 [Bdellovibrionales bacterium RIFOXYC2_FULL_39_8]OFZ76850.1 MAG: hypothetical protein A2560_05505 [Bdellovibrionales bacterium RIFOXYD1_FULL_39_84]OFZ95777.1 MAG: